MKDISSFRTDRRTLLKMGATAILTSVFTHPVLAAVGSNRQNAILLTSSDSDTFPIWYYHFGLGQRLDIRVIVEGLVSFEWYRETIAHTYPDLVFPEKDVSNLSEQFTALNPQVSVCHTRIDSGVTDSIRCVCP